MDTTLDIITLALKGNGNPNFISTIIEYIQQWHTIVINGTFLYQEGKQNRYLNQRFLNSLWLPYAPLQGKQRWILSKCDEMWSTPLLCGYITPSPIPEAARCKHLLRTGQLKYHNVSAWKLPPKHHCRKKITATQHCSSKSHEWSENFICAHIPLPLILTMGLDNGLMFTQACLLAT